MERNYLREVNERYPFDEESERKLNRNEFRDRDPNSLRGLRDRGYAALLWELWLSTEANLRSGRDALLRRRAAARARQDEIASLRRLAEDAIAGMLGRDAKAFANRLLVDDDGTLNLENPELLEAFRDGLRELRKERRAG